MASDDELIEAAPCPSCQSPLTVSAADLGHLVECPGCGTQFRARRTAPAAEPPPPPRPQRDDPPSFRDRDREEDDRRRKGTPGRERYYEREDEIDDRPLRERRPGSLTALAVMNFVYAGLMLVCGLLAAIIWLVVGDDLRQPGAPKPNLALDVLSLLAHATCGIVMLFAGTFALQRRGWGVSVGALLLAAVCLVLDMVDIAASVRGQAGPRDPDDEVGMVCGVASLAIFWLGYLVTNGILLAKAGRHFR